MKELRGDLIELAKRGRFDVIVHGCNCFCSMKAGIAKAVKEAFPKAYHADQETEAGDKSKLGTCTVGVHMVEGRELHIVNAYTQYDYKGSGILVGYDAVRSCFRWIKQQYARKRIGIPKIGAGLAKGDWDNIRTIIESELGGEDVTLVLKE